MNHDEGLLTAALDDCLQRLDAGASIDDCLAAYPEFADELAPLLRSARALQGRPRAIPTSQQLTHLEADFLRRVRPANRAIPRSYAVTGVVAALLIVFAAFFIFTGGEQEPESSAPTALPILESPTATASMTATVTPSLTSSPTATPTFTQTPTPEPTLAAVAPTPAPDTEQSLTTTTIDGAVTVTLWAGQNIDAGRLIISNDAENLYVTYQNAGDWVLTQTHVDIRAEVPPPNENPAPGQFAYKTDPPRTADFGIHLYDSPGVDCAAGFTYHRAGACQCCQSKR